MKCRTSRDLDNVRAFNKLKIFSWRSTMSD